MEVLTSKLVELGLFSDVLSRSKTQTTKIAYQDLDMVGAHPNIARWLGDGMFKNSQTVIENCWLLKFCISDFCDRPNDYYGDLQQIYKVPALREKLAFKL